MKKEKLRVLLTADAVGGVWQYATDLARGLSGLGIETILAVLGPSPSKAQLKATGSIKGLTLVDTGLPLDWLAKDRRSVRTAGETIAKLASGYSADVVQLNAPALAAEAKFGVPVVAVAHSCIATWWSAVKGTEIEAGYKWRAELAGQGLRAAAHVVAPTAAFAEATARAYGLLITPTTVHNGRSPLPLPRVAPHDFAFTAGRLWDKGKNAATLERAAAKLSIPFYAAGPELGPSGDSIRFETIKSLGTLSERELGRWLAAKPVFVSAAVYEPFGLAVLEAAAAGCPLVLADIPTFRELWGGVAAFADPMDPDGVAELIDLVIGDDFARARMGRLAQERAARFSVEAMAAKMAAIYRSLAGKTAAPAKHSMVAA